MLSDLPTMLDKEVMLDKTIKQRFKIITTVPIWAISVVSAEAPWPAPVRITKTPEWRSKSVSVVIYCDVNSVISSPIARRRARINIITSVYIDVIVGLIVIRYCCIFIIKILSSISIRIEIRTTYFNIIILSISRSIRLNLTIFWRAVINTVRFATCSSGGLRRNTRSYSKY